MANHIIEELRSIKGDTIGDIFKKFSLFIRNNDEITSNIEDILTSFIPENNVQKVFRLKLIDKYQRTSDLLQVLKEEDIFSTTRALNCKWFFTNLDGVNPTILENEILPFLSYSIRFKLLKKYSKYLKDTNKAEEFYSVLLRRYGIECALTILLACSPAFVKEALHNSTHQIKPVAIGPLFKSYPEVILNFFVFILESKCSKKRLYQNFNFDNYSNVFVQIASKYPERFVNMYIKYSKYFPHMSLGNRTAKRIIKSSPAVVIKNWDTFKNCLKVKHVKMYMNPSQIEELQFCYFPETLTEFFKSHWKLEQLEDITSYLGNDKKQGILLKNFTKRYGKELNVDEFAEVIDLPLMLLIPTEMRVKWVKRKLSTLETDSKKAEYLSYLPPDCALPELKNLITKQKEFLVRAHIVKCMMLSAKRYNDKSSLLECLSLVVIRLRNDNIRVRENVFNELACMKSILRELDTEEWGVIDELIDLVRMNDEAMSFSYNIREILPLKVEKYFLKGFPTNEFLTSFMNILMEVDSYYDYKLCKGTEYQKRCLEFFLSTFQSLTFEKDENELEAEIRLFSALCDYNNLHEKETVECPEWLLDKLEIAVINDKIDYYNKLIFMNALRSQPLLRNRVYMKVFPCFTNKDIALHILRSKPLIIKEHIETVMKQILNNYNINEYIHFFKQVTLYTSFNLVETIVNLCINLLKAKSTDSKGYESCAKPNSVLVLSILMSVEDFIKVVTPYKPMKEELEKFTDENRLQYRIQQAVASSLKYVNKPSEILSYIKSFAVGDYLKTVVGSLNSICLKVPEIQILPLLVEWLDCPVSLRKHFIRAYCTVAPIADTGNLIVSLLSKEKNISLRLLLLQHIFKFFLKEPSEESFEVFKKGYSQLTTEDVSTVDDLFDLKRIPDSFVAAFVKMIWEAVELKEGPLVTKSKTKIINMIDDDILKVLPEDFCDILLKHAFSDDSAEYRSFFTLYLVHVSDKRSQESRLEKFLQYIKQMIQPNWNAFNLHRPTVFQTRDAVFSIIENICGRSTQKDKLPVNPTSLLERLKLFVISAVPVADIIDEILRLEVSIFITASDMSNDNFVMQLANFYEEQLIKNCSVYGDQIIETVVCIMPYCLETYRLQLAKILLCEHPSYQAHLMAIRLINTDISNDVPTYGIIVDFLLKCNNPRVKAAAGGFLRNLNSNVLVC